MAPFEIQKRTTLKTQAFKQIKEAILSGELKPGDRIVESELAKRMGISRFPIREALGYLEKEGLVVTSPYRGIYVSQFNDEDLEESYTLRSALEELAVRIVTKKINKRQLNKLQSILNAMDKAAKKRDLEKITSEDLQFHRTICEFSGHRKLLEVWSTLEHRIKSFSRLANLHKGSDILFKTHYLVFDALRAGDSQRAEILLRQHFYEILQFLEARKRGRTNRDEKSS